MNIDLAKQKWTLRGWRPNCFHQLKALEEKTHWQPDVGPIKAIVPGSAQTALRAAKLLPDWNVGLNSLACEWVEHRQWEFRTTLPSFKPTLRETVTLRCDGLDYSGWIAIDAKIIGEFRGALRRQRFDLTHHVSDGQPHTLSILFDTPPAEQGQVGATSKSEFFKPRYSYSWDWCPRLVPVGIWDRIWIEQGPARPRVVKVLTSLAEDLQTGRVNVFLSSETSATVRVSILRSHGRKSVDTRSTKNSRSWLRQNEQTIAPGDSVVRLDDVPVEAWNPNGAGDQPLYELLVEVDGEAVDRRTVGFKRVRWLPNPDAPPGARPMLCEVNGKPLFLRGVNWTPIRMDFHDIPAREYAKRINLYKKLGCNVLRVWGGAFLEREIFYQLCDEAGLLVWQEFPLSSSGPDNCAPESPDAIQELTLIATDYIHRRAHHACKLLWCGGNELQSLPNQNGEQFPLTESHPCLAALKRVVDREDPETRYLPTSPAGPTFFATRENMGKGFHHHVHGPWNHDSLAAAQDYFAHDDSTFRSETGMPGAQSLAMMRRYVGGEKTWPPTKDNQWWVHSSLWWLPGDRFKRELRGKKGAGALKTYVAASQQLQADVLELAARTCRSRFPTCSGFLVWMGHDAFPCAANTSIIDFDGNPKPAYHALAKVFKMKE